MLKDDQHWLSVVENFSAAALGTGTWITALENMADVTGSRAGELIGLGADNAVPFNWLTDLGQDWADDFIAADGGNPEVNPYVRHGAGLSELQVASSAEIVTPGERRTTPFMMEFLAHYDVPYICLSPLVKEPGLLVGLAVVRSQGQGEITAAQRAVFSSLAPHVRSAVKTQMALEHQGADLVAGTLEALSFAAFVCDRLGVVRSMTPLAEQLVSEGGLLKLRHGVLTGPSRHESRRLAALIDRAALGLVVPGAPLTRTLILNAGASAPLVLDVVPLPRQDYAFNFRPRVLVIVRARQSNPDHVCTLLRMAHGLTQAEADVAVRLAAGESPEHIAMARGASIATVRVQIRAVYQKLGVHRAGELAAHLKGIG
ncbi:helix-turn-helix transcriptional regulator [Isoalcanivorax indicus]|uniref:helix-turn-helix transcriptional regulator n=1 Tax=Isoalcanivorax indicus TaxID=2202653 RepID=UPI0013C51A0D|nr:helix-turn-helix transcriptional regulator [Isoalcanivorax indicus]